jgi:uncharacterized repeat protein (TIGR03803 family)
MHDPVWFVIRQSSSRNRRLCVLLFFLATTIGAIAQEYTTVANFAGPNGNGPTAALIPGADGNFYGTTINGGTGSGSAQCLPPYGGCGTIFQVTPSGTITSLHSFCSDTNCTDGSFPHAGLVRGADGNYYGTTVFGGGCTQEGGCGTVFKITPQGTFTQLYNFCLQTNCPDGFWPVGSLILASDGNFYGTTQGGGTHRYGTVYKITPAGSFSTVYNFCSLENCADGSQPQAALIQAADGNLYGTTSLGGRLGVGTVFRITLSGGLTTLYSFNGNHGSAPLAPLIQATDGNFYGTTQSGGATNDFCNQSGCGTVFKVTPSGTLTTLYSFSGPDGGLVLSGLLQATDGNLYGTTWNGGANGEGTVFKLTTDGTFTLLHSFTPSDGGGSEGGFLQAVDGSLYGITGLGGASGFGTISRLTFPMQFVPLTPCRLVDTRQTDDPIQGGTVRNLSIPQLGECGVPSAAAGYSLNITVVPHGALRYLTMWPAGESQPNVSTLNALDGRVKANATIATAGNNKAVSVYAADTTDVILDINGYFTPPGSQTLQFYPVPPCRLVDTRNPDGPLGGPRLEAQQERDFPLLMSSCIPTGANPVAYSLNVTAVPDPQHQPVGYLTLWPAQQTQPETSRLNNPTGTVVANAAIVQAGNQGEVAVWASNSTDLLIDVNGYFAMPGQGGNSFYSAPPCRAYDSRTNNGQPFSGQIQVNMLNSVCAPPGDATGFVLNATVVPDPTLGYLTLWPDQQVQPVVSTLNAADGFVTSNMAIVPNSDGTTDAFAGNGTTHLILDLYGFFAP